MGERRCRCRCRCWMSGMGSRGDLASGALLSPPRSHARTHTHTHIYICVCACVSWGRHHRHRRVLTSTPVFSAIVSATSTTADTTGPELSTFRTPLKERHICSRVCLSRLPAISPMHSTAQIRTRVWMVFVATAWTLGRMSFLTWARPVQIARSIVLVCACFLSFH